MNESLHTPSVVIKFREAINAGFPGAKITWAFSWLALHDTTSNYRKIRELVVGYQSKYGDEITFIPGAYFANAYNPTEQVNKDLHDGLAKVSEIVGNGYRPKSVVAGFLSAKNQDYLAKNRKEFMCAREIYGVSMPSITRMETVLFLIRFIRRKSTSANQPREKMILLIVLTWMAGQPIFWLPGSEGFAKKVLIAGWE